MSRQRLTAPTEIEKDGSPVTEDLSETLGQTESSILLFGDRIGIERLVVATHVLVAKATILVYERSQQVGLLRRSPHHLFTFAVQRVQDYLTSVECLLITP